MFLKYDKSLFVLSIPVPYFVFYPNRKFGQKKWTVSLRSYELVSDF